MTSEGLRELLKRLPAPQEERVFTFSCEDQELCETATLLVQKLRARREAPLKQTVRVLAGEPQQRRTHSSVLIAG